MLDLMRRYVYGFVNSHDPEVARAIMAPDYTLHVGSETLVGRDSAYIPAVMRAISQTPGLTMTIHKLITDGTLAALMFSEHGRSAKFPDRAASWRGVSIYRAQAGRLAECWVEQDYFGKRVQSERRETEPVSPVDIDPWTNHVPSAPDTTAAGQEAVAAWLGNLTWWPPAGAACDRGITEGLQPRIEVTARQVNALVVEGSRVAFNAMVSGRYLGGLPGHEAVSADAIRVNFGAFARVVGGTLADVDAISGRLFVQSQLRS